MYTVSILILLLAPPASHQTKASKVHHVKQNELDARKKPLPPSTTRMGEITQQDSASIQLREVGGVLHTYTCTTNTRFWKADTLYKTSPFTIGNAVVLHVHHNRKADTYSITDCADNSSWKWLLQLRRTIENGTVTAVDDTTLTLLIGQHTYSYHVEPSSLWGTKNTVAASDPFTVGSSVWIVPRYLPSGLIAVRAAADTAHFAAILKERSAPSVHATLVSLNPVTHTITLHTAAGDLRKLPLADSVVVKRGKASLPLTSLHPGARLVVRIHRASSGVREVWRISIDLGKARKS